MRKFLLNNRGVATVEFVLTIFWYLFIVFLIFECARVTLSVAYWDLALSEATRIAKNQQATDTQEGQHDYKSYSFKYDYTFLIALPFIPQDWISALYNRKIVAVQEYERN